VFTRADEVAQACTSTDEAMQACARADKGTGRLEGRYEGIPRCR